MVVVESWGVTALINVILLGVVVWDTNQLFSLECRLIGRHHVHLGDDFEAADLGLRPGNLHQALAYVGRFHGCREEIPTASQ